VHRPPVDLSDLTIALACRSPRQAAAASKIGSSSGIQWCPAVYRGDRRCSDSWQPNRPAKSAGQIALNRSESLVVESNRRLPSLSALWWRRMVGCSQQ
jgi:hypothetical protein